MTRGRVEVNTPPQTRMLLCRGLNNWNRVLGPILLIVIIRSPQNGKGVGFRVLGLGFRGVIWGFPKIGDPNIVPKMVGSSLFGPPK